MRKINIKNLFRLSLQNEVRPLHFVLANRGKEKLGEIDNVFEVSYHPQLQTYTINFTIYKNINGKECRLWDEIISRRLLWIKEYDEWFELSIKIDDSQDIIKKTITATALCQAELSNINLDNAEINTQADIERIDYEVCTFYNPEQTNISILHRLLKKVPNYTIKHVDNTLYNIQRSFSISDNTNIYNFLTGTLSEEIGCLFLFDSNERGIYVYDMQTTCLECGHRDEAEFNVCPKCGNTTIKNAYGDDTTIFVSKDNLGEGIQLTSNANEVKNCYKVSGGDDIINAAIINSNPNGTNTIYAFDEDTRRDMSVDLIEKLDSYNTLVEEYKTFKKFDLSDTIVEQYNSLISKINSIYPDSYTALNSAYTGYSNVIKILYNISDLDIYVNNGMMPTWEQSDKTAQSQISLIESELTTVSVRDVSVISKSTADNAVLLMVKAIIDSNIYKAEIINSTLSSQTWTGQIKLTNYSDAAKEDVATSRTLTITINDDTVSFVKQRIQKETAKIDTLGVSNVLTIDNMDDFKTELKKYCLASLKGFLNAYQTVLDVLIEENMSNKSSELYDILYLPYYNKLGAIENEILVRESDIEIISALKDELQQIINNTHEKLDFENYLGEDLWNTFLSYRREDNYTNEHYISDGLTNDEVIAKAEELIEVAYKELIKSSSKQYTITATLHNLLLIVDENGNQVFAPILDDFTLGNFIRCKIDGVVYKMRIMDVTIDYDNLNKLSITFGDVSKGTKSIVDKMSDVIKQTNSIAASYSAVKKQAKQGETANYNMEKLRQEGLNSAQYNVFNTNSTFIMDEHGLLGRNYDDVSNQFSLEQLRINGSNIILSSDGGKSTDLAVGKQTYTINGVQYEDYCVNAKTVIGGKVIAGDIFSANYTTDENGNIIKGNHFGLEDSSFELADGKMIYDNSTNTLKLKDVTLDWNTVTTPSISNINGLENELNNLNNSIKSTEEEFANEITDYAAQFNGSISDLQNQIDGNITTWFYDGEPTLNNSPANEWTAVEDKNRHLGDLYYDNLTGYAYRFQLSGTIYSWVKITDSDVTKALADAKNAQDTADNKRRVFVSTPTPPYDIGDLWVQGDSGDIMRCTVAKTSGSYSVDDWVKASKYTDDTKANEALIIASNAQMSADNAKSVAENAEIIGKNLVNILGYDGTKITGTYIYSPVIFGGTLLIGNKNGTYAEITTNGVLNCAGANFQGSITGGDININNRFIVSSNGDVTLPNNATITWGQVTDSPTIPSAVSDLENDLNFATKDDLDELLDNLPEQSDAGVDTYYQETQPYDNYSSETEINAELEDKVGDIWFNTVTRKTYQYIRQNSETQGYDYYWKEIVAVPNEVFDAIDGKKTIYTSLPTSYEKDDMYILESARGNWTKGTILTAIVTATSTSFYSAHWQEPTKYTDDTLAQQALDEATQAIKDAANGINLAKTAQARAEEAEANAEDYAATAQTNAEKYAKDYADTQDNTLSTNLTTAYENYTDSKISDFDNLVAKYLGLSGNTLIGNNYIISPIIQGGYANITNRDNGSRVIIDPNNLTGTGYIFQVHNGAQITIGIGSDGHATFQGTVYANAGEFTGGIIGGWDITKTDIYNNQSTTSAGIGTYNVSPAFWAGTSYNNRSSAPFRVTHDGSLYANKAVIEGEVIATSGKVGKLEITDTFIEYNGGEGDVVGLGATMALYAGSTNSAQAPFRVGYDGSLYANNATITGSITATSGKIGRYEITDTYLEYYESSTKVAGMGGNQAFYAGNSSSNSAPFHVGYDGSLYSIKGEIAGWTITEESFVGSTTSGGKKTQLNSNGTMELFCYNENVTKRAQFSVRPGNIIISPNSTNNGLITLFSYEFTSSMIEKLYELVTS